MAYYDKIAKQWHEATGYKGGPFKELVLNAVLLDKIGSIDGCAILELGTGNGYFLPLALRRFSGQVPASITITDQSSKLLDIAKKHFRIPGAVYQPIDVCKPFPFDDDSVDLILASMVFNEVPTPNLRKALAECQRVLSSSGLLLMTVLHPDFVDRLDKEGLLKTTKAGLLTMPGSGSLRLPVIVRSAGTYRRALAEAGFDFEEEEVFPTADVVRAKTGLRHTRGVPLALVFACRRTGTG